MSKPHPLWDLPTRLFHWLLVLGIALAWLSGEWDQYDRHAWIGYAILVLVTFRIVWGLVGSYHSRFAQFLVGPGRISDYLRGRGEPVAGHNPLGGWSVVVMLALVLAQAVSGLFNSDDVLFNGPFYYAASGEFRDAMGVVHEYAFDVLVGFIALHVAAVLFHQFRLREKLLQAMLRGSAQGREGLRAPVSPWLALVIIVVLGLLLWAAVANAPKPAPMW